MHFLWGEGRAGMIVLHQEAGESPQQHFAFTVSPEDLDAAVASLREQGVEVTEPITGDWMNARSAYSEDPDGNALEFCAPNA